MGLGSTLCRDSFTFFGHRTLYKIKEGKTLDIGVHPDGAPDVDIHPEQLPATLLEVRRGPSVLATTAPQNVPISLQNVFILIAPGRNRNDNIDRLFIRDSNHVTSGGGNWNLGITEVDDYIFSTEPRTDVDDTADSGDDTLLFMSFQDFRQEMKKYGFNMESNCETSC